MTPSGSEDSFRAIVSGRVQGVGFRWFVQDRAEELGLRGTVCNRRDGSVEVQAAGERETLEQLLTLLRRGPSASRVDDVNVDWECPPPSEDGFHITRG